MRRRNFLATVGTIGITGCSSREDTESESTKTSRVETRTVYVTRKETPTPKIETVVETVVVTPTQTPEPDKPTIGNVYLHNADSGYVYIKVRYSIANREGTFYPFEHLVLKDDTGAKVADEKLEREVETAESGGRVTVTPIRYAISRRDGIPTGTYTVEFRVQDPDTNEWSNTFETTIEIETEQ